MLKKILFGLLGIILLLVIVGFLLPGKFEITRSMSINAPAAYAFEEVNNLQNWNKWSYWNTLDPDMKMEYGDKTSGTGASYTWDGPEVGKGKVTISESVPFSSVKVDLDFMEQGTSLAWYTFEPEGEGTKATMGFSTDFGMNPIMRWMGVTMFESEMDKAFNYGLTKIKEAAEAKPKFSTEIREENVAPVFYVGLSHTMSSKDQNAISMQMSKMYGELLGALQKANVEPAGAPFCLYPKYTEESMDFVCAIPVSANAKVPAKYKIMEMPGGKAVKGIHKGGYGNLGQTHGDLNNYISYKKLQINGAPREVYITDPEAEADTSKWVTEIYYPVN